ncbi:MAG TPA: hypothetical protein QF564_04590 [Pirellulaceae bacterium]|nr:hypothetical protein [Pirellulaceae bacterium]
MSTTQTEFDRLEQELANTGVAGVLDQLVSQLREKKKYHELFEALKMRVRHGLGLPITYSESGDELDEPRRNGLEEGLIDACREVGMLLLRDGFAREGWMYMRPVGDRAAVAKELEKIEPTEESVEELIEVCLHEGVDPARGYSLVLEHFGTCNAITTYESSIARHPIPDQRTAAGLLVRHLHGELLSTVQADIAQQEGTEPPETTLAELVAHRDWMFGEHSYHIDTTHLASTVRFSRILEDPELLRLALDLTAYGRRLSSQFQYQGDEPFGDIYPSTAFYLSALLGEGVDEAIAYFRNKVAALDTNEHGSQPMEAFVQLLDRVNRPSEAIDALIDFSAAPQQQDAQVVPILLELSEKMGDFEKVKDLCRKRGDVLGFASSLIQASN